MDEVDYYYYYYYYCRHHRQTTITMRIKNFGITKKCSEQNCWVFRTQIRRLTEHVCTKWRACAILVMFVQNGVRVRFSLCLCKMACGCDSRYVWAKWRAGAILLMFVRNIFCPKTCLANCDPAVLRNARRCWCRAKFKIVKSKRNFEENSHKF
jgi:hypothetical protein